MLYRPLPRPLLLLATLLLEVPSMKSVYVVECRGVMLAVFPSLLEAMDACVKKLIRNMKRGAEVKTHVANSDYVNVWLEYKTEYPWSGMTDSHYIRRVPYQPETF